MSSRPWTQILFAGLLIPLPSRSTVAQTLPAGLRSPIAERLFDAERAARSVDAAGKAPVRYTLTGADGTRFGLAAVMDGVPMYRKTANVAQSRLIGVERARDEFGVTGVGIRIGLWDEGHAYPHIEFGARLDPGTDVETSVQSVHATHVAGTLMAAGLDAEARGVASAAEVETYDWSFDYNEMYLAAEQGLRVSDHSYTFATGWERSPGGSAAEWTWFHTGLQFGVYNSWAWCWDVTLEANPYFLAVKAAGNDAGQGPDTPGAPHFHDGFDGAVHTDTHPTDCANGYGCLGPVATSKNALVIGSLDAAAQSLSPFSSRGPTADGRLKPDLMTVGEAVYSTIGIDAYSSSSGTSMAAPMAAGSVALVLDQEWRLWGERRFLSSTMKALLVHTADDLGSPGPDFTFGWGRINAGRAVALVADDFAADGSLILQPVVSGAFEVSVPTDGSPLRVTLAWTDPRNLDLNDRSDPTAPLIVRDLDLEVVTDEATHLPWLLDPASPDAPALHGRDHRNNIEQVYLASTPQDDVTIRVRVPEGGTQQASLVISSGQPIIGTGIEGPSDRIVPGSDPTVDLYPNPVLAGHDLHVESAEEVSEVGLYDIVGRRLGRWVHPGGSVPIPSGMAPGVYIARASTARGVISRTVVVR